MFVSRLRPIQLMSFYVCVDNHCPNVMKTCLRVKVIVLYVLVKVRVKSGVSHIQL